MNFSLSLDYLDSLVPSFDINEAVNTTEYEVNWGVVFARLLIFVAGTIGNLLVIFVIVILQEYKKAVTHWYVLQLAIADLFFILTFPFDVDVDVYGAWRYPNALCKVKEAIRFINYYASIMFLMIMSIDRYIAVCHRFSDRLQKLRSHSSAYKITALIWLLTVLSSTPNFIYQ